jgi:hypothetical protein
MRRENHIRRRLQSQNGHPIAVGRHVSWGCLQSMPDRRYPSCAEEIVTTPSAGLGHKKRPRSRRFVNKHAPWPSCKLFSTDCRDVRESKTDGH